MLRLKDYKDYYGKVYISLDVRSAVGEWPFGGQGQGGFDAFLSITFLNTSISLPKYSIVELA